MDCVFLLTAHWTTGRGNELTMKLTTITMVSVDGVMQDSAGRTRTAGADDLKAKPAPGGGPGLVSA
jgi:hypothetical protein